MPPSAKRVAARWAGYYSNRSWGDEDEEETEEDRWAQKAQDLIRKYDLRDDYSVKQFHKIRGREREYAQDAAFESIDRWLKKENLSREERYGVLSAIHEQLGLIRM